MKENKEFQCYVQDILDYGTYRFESLYVHDEPEIIKGFVRYGRYSRKDVSRILNYETNREGTLNGYQIVGATCPIFVTYEKRDDISANTKYEDQFVSPQQFSWMTRARIHLTSSQIPAICNEHTRKLLFVKERCRRLRLLLHGRFDGIRRSCRNDDCRWQRAAAAYRQFPVPFGQAC